MLTPNFHAGSLNNIKSEDIQSFELAPGIEQTRAGTDASDSIDEALFRDSNAGYDLDLQGYNGNEMLDSNATDGLPKVPSISAPVARKRKRWIYQKSSLKLETHRNIPWVDRFKMANT